MTILLAADAAQKCAEYPDAYYWASAVGAIGGIAALAFGIAAIIWAMGNAARGHDL